MAPPVVVVMVAHDPGAWWEDALRSIALQSYPNVATFIVDTASAQDLTARVAAVLPEAHLRRLEADPGFGPAANEAILAIEGAAFFLLCHDDVVLDPTAVQAMVEEAFRSNAGIVGPKIVDWNDPATLVQVGMGADKFGVPSPLVDRGELDQEQHDAVRDVFFVPGAATLVRADLFASLGGFDPGIDLLGEDLDLCWRAHMAGARVLVAPAARVAHKEALDERRDTADRRRLTYQHRLRTVMTDYGRFHRWRVLPQAFVLAVVEVVSSVLIGRLGQARDVIGAWTANLGDRRAILDRRKQVAAARVVRDAEIRRLQVRGSASASAFFRGQFGANDDRLAGMAGAGRDLANSLRAPTARLSLAAWVVVLVVLTIGSRDLLTAPIPAIGEFVSFDSGPLDLFRQWASGYHSAGLGSDAANPTALGFLGSAGLVFLGAMGQLRRVLILGLLPLGVLGMWRLARPIGSRRSRVVALVLYAAVPLATNSIAGARWSGLVLYALSPWIINQLARASRLAPFGPVGDDAGPGVTERPVMQRIVILGLLTALGTMAVPFTIAVMLGVAVALAVGGLLVGQGRGIGRMLFVAIGAALVTFVLNLPWSLDFVTRQWASVAAADAVPAPALDLGEIVRFATGPVTTSNLAYAFLGAAALALLIGRRWRLAWAVRGWMLALAGWGLVFAASKGYLVGFLPAPEVLLAPGAVGLALAGAMGMAAFEVDLPDYHFGWRQLASVLAGAALVVALVPVLGAATEGRWGLPGGDYDQFLDRLTSPSESFRSLWVGDEATLPGTPWPLGTPGGTAGDRGLAYLTTTGRTASVDNLWPGSQAGATTQLRHALDLAATGQTDHLGALLAPMGIEFIVVPERTAPPPYENTDQVDLHGLRDVLAAQLDLAEEDMPSGITVYRNTMWGPVTARLPRNPVLPTAVPEDGDQPVPGLAGAPDALPTVNGYANASGPVPQPAVIYVATAGSDRWQLTVNGAPQQRADAFGWANQYTVDSTGQAQLRYQTSKARYAWLLGVSALWLLALAYVWQTRVRKEGERDLVEVREAHDL